MSSSLAVTALICLYLLLSAPAVAAFLRPKLLWAAGSFYYLLVVVIIVNYIDFSVDPMPAPRGPPAQETSGHNGSAVRREQCEQAVETAEQGGLFLDRASAQVTVRGDLWNQLPELVQRALVSCLERTRSDQASKESIRVVVQ